MSVEHAAAHDPRPSVLTRSRCRPLRVLVCGSREWGDIRPINDRLALLPRGSVIIHGAASRRTRTGIEVSADMLADHVARALGFEVESFPADWKAQPRRAGFIRNLAMLDTRPDLVLAFQRNGSRGTQHTVENARKRGIPVEVCRA